MKARRLTNSLKTKRSRKFMFPKLRFPRIFRKRRVSVTRMSAWQADPSNHGTKPKTSPTRYLERSAPPTVTPMATASTNAHASTTTFTTASSGESFMGSPSLNYPETVERDEEWVQQLETEQQVQFDIQAQVMYNEYIAKLAAAGPFEEQTRQLLEQRYREGLEQLKQLQREEIDQHIEMERQERLWSLGQQDPSWEGRRYEEQSGIMAQIHRDRERSSMDKENMHEKIRENLREGEDSLRRSEEWRKSEPARARNRKQWAERTRQTNANISARRDRDRAESVAYAMETRAREEQSARLAEEARQGAAKTRARTSQATFNGEFDTARQGAPIRSPVSESSSRSSVSESIFSSSPTADTAASSVPNDRWTPTDTQPKPNTSRTIPISTSVHDDMRRSGSNPFGGSSPSSRARPAGMSTQASPLTGTPLTNTNVQAKNTEPARATVWIPPETAREPGEPVASSRRGSTQFDGKRDPPIKKTSMLFGESPGPPPPRTLDEPSSRSQTQNPGQGPTPYTQPHASQSPQSARATASSQPPLNPPSAPGIRTQPLPQTQPPSAPRNSFSSVFPNSKHSTSANPVLNTGSPNVKPGIRPTAGPSQTPPTDEYRTKMRSEYVGKEADRVEEERRRREQEANERRAEDARRRGAEKRRQEEQAREAERREAERKTRKASINNMHLVSDRPVLEVWNSYESQWAAMATAAKLRFRSIPWPVLAPVSSPDMLLPIYIANFILNPQHSQGKSRKDRLREALLRWHPDRFEAKWLKKVVEEERDSVQEGVGCVVRVLNDLLSTEGTFAA